MDRETAGGHRSDSGGPPVAEPHPERPGPHGSRPALPHEHVLCLAQELDPRRPGLTLAMAFELRGGCDPELLLRALRQLVRRHEALRARFVRSGEHWLRVVDPAERVDAEPDRYAASETLTDTADDERVQALLEERCREYPDLSAGPLFRATVLTAAHAAQDGAENDTEHDTEDDAEAPVRLVVRVHHAVADLWAVGVLMAELHQLYRLALDGRERDDVLPPAVPLTHPEVASGRRERAERFWTGLWEDGHEPLDLPRATAQPPRPGLSRATHRVPLDLGESRTAALRAYAKECEVSRYTVLFAAQALALARLGNSARPPLSVSMHGRNSGNARAVGYALSTAVLPVDTASGTAGEYLRRVHGVLRGALAHQCLGYPELAAPGEGGPGTDMPAPEVTLAMFQDPAGLKGLGAALLSRAAIPLGGLTMRTVVPPVSVGPWLAAGALADDGRNMFGFVDVDPAHHPAWLAERLAEMLPAVVDALIAHPETALDDLDTVPAADRELLASWSRAAPEPGIDEATLHGEVLEAAARHPERTAVTCRDGDLTYAELDERSAAFAAELRRAGAGPGSVVGVLLSRGRNLVPALLGALRAGCAYVGLDRSAPAHRTARVVAQAGCAVVVTDATTEELGRAMPCATLSAATVPTRPAAGADPGGDPSVRPDEPAYLMFTSGSTGRPKGVVIAHRSAVNLVRFGRRTFSTDELRESLAVSGVHFDLSVWEIFLPLSAGQRVRLLENALELIDLPQPPPGTFLSSVPSAVATCVQRRALPPELRLITMGGDTIGGDLVRDIARQCPQARIVAMYGPTETTTYMTWSEVGAETGDPVPLGRPFGGTTLRVVDERLRDVPLGATGELLIGGPCVALGYAGEAAMTAARFLPDPDASEPVAGAVPGSGTGAGPGARLYRSGDLVRWRPDGLLDFAGRVDHQVKVRGFRIELGEVEACLRETTPLDEAVVHVVGTGSDRRLLACLVPAGPAPADPVDWLRGVRDRLAALVPAYMLPSDYAVLDEIPKNRNGKPDRQRLAQLPAVRIGHGEQAPLAGAVQERLGRLWRQLLEVPEIGARDDFFESGGHSLLLARLAQLVTAEFGVETQVAQLWNARTIAEQEAVLAAAPRADAAAAARPVRRLDRTRHTHRPQTRQEAP
ncbi:amino acid adenylation domain-containing protein [Streptomyces sp. Amel2xB2]|uniref:non-ribosomal peptide synthetase n=1 Tax=Streptomyces sp. Amel2xB2 TaxID=1305829 RepID=UPI000DB9D90B|nr:non-ribosomal peptide synthetase [Streptomyces sp. Amel2xB2]RAJ58800.1 amino acid adenylation domain-containing protein [Streptomyces sp. Amel2xB2]